MSINSKSCRSDAVVRSGIAARLAEIQARADKATDGPWERGDHYHVQAASHCQCRPDNGPLVSKKRMDINGTMMLAHVHRRDEPLWPYGIYSPGEFGGALVVQETSEYGYIDDADAEFIASARIDVPALTNGLESVLDYVDRCEESGTTMQPGDIRRLIAAALGGAS